MRLLASEWMARPVFHPHLGAFFRSLREAEGWKQSDAARFADQRQLFVLTRQVILRLEKGKTKWPSPDVLRAVGELYDIPYGDLVHRVTQHAYRLDAGATLAVPRAGHVRTVKARVLKEHTEFRRALEKIAGIAAKHIGRDAGRDEQELPGVAKTATDAR